MAGALTPCIHAARHMLHVGGAVYVCQALSARCDGDQERCKGQRPCYKASGPAVAGRITSARPAWLCPAQHVERPAGTALGFRLSVVRQGDVCRALYCGCLQLSMSKEQKEAGLASVFKRDDSQQKGRKEVDAREKDPAFVSDAYSECYPDYHAFGTTVMDDEDADFTHMDNKVSGGE